ncbi:MAG TPA: cation:proton antiporter [Acidimicrobiales bacterium]|nr:cation:proton antiporter [Acidimicrobiales bacterium]
MNLGDVLFHILVVLVAAKVAAELAERIGVPAVVAEILAGVLIGPSALNLVGHDEILTVLGELGVLLLLLDVGLEMDLGELAAVGRASIAVAFVGVAIPFAAGAGVAAALGHGGNTAVFVGAALTATSVGITARVFGDLRALATVEARTVLGAAVADDVLGLVILTVVVRLVGEGSVSLASVAGVIAIAVGFLVAAAYVGIRVAPPGVRLLQRFARSPGTLVAIVFAFTLTFAKLAQGAGLAPIVGAFVAGVALSRSNNVERIRRELTPVGHLFIPVFFLQIGIDADLKAMAKPSVIGLALALLAVAAIGKLLAAVGAFGSPGDKLLIGIGMLPRGEVGLIFAGIGLRNGILSDDLYAALLIVVLATTLITPSMLKARLRRVQQHSSPREVVLPEGGRWMTVDDGVINVHGSPPPDVALQLALRGARLGAEARPSASLIDMASALAHEEGVQWDVAAADELLDLLRTGTPRSWRFLEVTGVLATMLPELADALRRRRANPAELDPAGVLRWTLIDSLRGVVEDDPVATEAYARLEKPEWLMLALLILDAAGPDAAPVDVGEALVRRLNLGRSAEEEICLLVGERDLLRAAARRADALEEARVLALATHIARSERATALLLLTLAEGGIEGVVRGRLLDLHDRIQAVLSHPELSGSEARTALDQRRNAAVALAAREPDVAQRIATGPRTWLLSHPPDVLLRHARLVEPVPLRRTVRVRSTYDSPESLVIDVAGRDAPGFLAAVTGVLASHGIDVAHASAASWSDGGVIETFTVRTGVSPDTKTLERAISAALGSPPRPTPVEGVRVSFDDAASPWTTICDIEAPDRAGLLHQLAAAFTSCGIDVRSAVISGDGTLATDRFELTDGRGRKLSETVKQNLTQTLGGAHPSKRFARRH